MDNNALAEIGKQLNTQDNRATQDPMFCVQIKRRDVGYDAAWVSGECWRDFECDETVYDDDKDFTSDRRELIEASDKWDKFGYVDRWETVMACFTERGCKEYLEVNGHNDRMRAHKGEVRIYVQSFCRCEEMILIRRFLKEMASK